MAVRDGAEKEHIEKGSPPAFHYLFEEQAGVSPDATALVDRGGELTYRELERRASLLARELAARGVGRGSVVGIYMERCSEFVVAMIASMKAGAAFLPMELAYPQSMLDEVVVDASPVVVLTKGRYAGDISFGVDTIRMDEGWHESLAPPEDVDLPEVSADDLLFIAYSSGTTGKPKGIANPHRAAVGSYLWRFGVDSPSPGDRVGCNVFFIWEALRPLLVGATSVVIPDEEIYDPKSLVLFLGEFRVTETLVTPSLLETVLNHSEDTLEQAVPSLKTLWLNGEVVTRALVERASEALPHTRLLTVYSISEAHEVAAGDLRELSENPHSTYCPVGEPMSDNAVHILDEEMHPVPDGEPGELYVGGDWLATEYVNLPEKTAERFLEHPSAGRVYRTGDRARRLPEGEIEILGRCDFMVKVRGYSIELGAVENAIEVSLPVQSCCVVADGEEGADKRLVAYLVPSEENALPEISENGRSPEAREVLRDSLPHYAIPAVYVSLDALPLQETTGKVDRTLLPDPPRGDGAGVPDARDIRLSDGASVGELESALCRVFESVLRLDEGDVSPEDDFFEIGGHSLAAAEATGTIEDVSGVALPVGDFLEASSPKTLAALLKGRRGSPDTSDGDASREKVVRAMEEDADLDADIRPEDALPKSITEARSVFVTGGTGFLGAFLISSILERSDAEVVCLVRDRRDGSTTKSKLRDNLRFYRLWKPWMEKRLSGVAGDLGSERLGLSDGDFQRLSEETDFVVHAGASVNLIYPYSSLRQANVEGTREVLRLCCTGSAKPLVHVSTNGVFPPDHGLCAEDADLDSLRDGLSDGYGQSKWVAEKLVREAQGRGLPTCIFRPGNISGHSETGASNPRDFLSALFDACLKTGSAPDIDGWTVEMTPVDFVTGAILEISSDPDSYGKTFHLANPSPEPAATVFDDLEDPDDPLERVGLGEWLEDLSRLRGSDLAKTALSGEPEHLFQTDSSRCDDRNTRAALDGTGVTRPETDSRLLQTYRKALRHGRELVENRT